MAKDKERVDLLLVEKGLCETRTRAQALVMAGLVFDGERRLDKPGERVPRETALEVRGQALPYVSRGGLKLQAALDHFGVDVRGQVALDVGASTGGFTDCLLQRGATRVYAVDVGYGQLHERLRTDPRVVSHERVNARDLSVEVVPEMVGVVVADVSFISLRLILPGAVKRLAPGGVLVALVKPQFEVGREHVGKGGVVRDGEARAACIAGMVEFAGRELGLVVRGTIDSPIAGPAGNVEALLVADRPPR
jgi:23S rRNA (cytidine1920-2'-O)/16S rRNA (cytidine1409-2'-O)-methyltransferase